MHQSAPSSPLLSVVVPIYGVEEWLPSFLDSLIAQSFTDWEGILVIDGSPDGCLEIAHAYAARDSRLSVHSFPNGGVGKARNGGLRLAHGRYVTFPDPDDLLAPDAYTLLVGSLVGSGSDLATAVGEDFFADGRRMVYWAQRSDLFKHRRIGVDVSSEPRLVLDHVTWNKVFRTSFLQTNQIEYPEETVCEDVVHSMRAMVCADSVDVLPDVVYAHRRRDFAITSDIMGTRIVEDWLRQTRDAIEILVRDGAAAARRPYFERLLTVEVWSRIQNFDRIGDDADLQKLGEFVAHVLEHAADAQVKLPRFKQAVLRFAGAGGLSARWRAPGIELNPLNPGEDAAFGGSEVVVEAVRRLDVTDKSEQELAVLLLQRSILRPLLRAKELEADWLEAVSGLLIDRWPDINPARVAALLTPTELALLAAVRDGDVGRVHTIRSIAHSQFEPLLERIDSDGEDVLLLGSVAIGSAIGDDARWELVLRSQTSRETRKFPVTVWRVRERTEQFQWRAVLPTASGLLNEEWQVRVRMLHPVVARVEAPLRSGSGLRRPTMVALRSGQVLVVPFGAPELKLAMFPTLPESDSGGRPIGSISVAAHKDQVENERGTATSGD